MRFLLYPLPLCTFNKYSMQVSKVDLLTIVLKFSTVYYVTIHPIFQGTNMFCTYGIGLRVRADLSGSLGF